MAGQGAGACCCAGAAVIPAGAGCVAAAGIAAGFLAAGLLEVVFLAAGFLVGFCADGGAGLSSTITGLGRNDVALPAAAMGSMVSDSGR